MKSKEWYEIEQVYENQIHKNDSKANSKFEGLHHVVNLIPLLKKSGILATAKRNIGFFVMSFHLPTQERVYVDIIPPSPILSGSSVEFKVIQYSHNLQQENTVLRKTMVSYLSLDEVVNTAEQYFLQSF